MPSFLVGTEPCSPESETFYCRQCRCQTQLTHPQPIVCRAGSLTLPPSARYNDPPRGELQHLAFQRCSDAVPYFQSQRRHVAAMKALVTRHGRVRAKMEAMVIRKGANFLRWTR